MKYKCLVLDHDDTVVNSTASIHYPSFVEYLKIARPALADSYTLTSYFEKNFHPGILSLLQDEVGLDDEEMMQEEAFWREYVQKRVPTAFPGMRELMENFRAAGGYLVIDSHSYSHYIRRDVTENGIPMPDIIYGWDIEPEQRKPSPYTLFDVMKRFSLAPSEILVVDDLKPGYDMARAAGCDFAAAGWAYDVPAIEEFMRKNCDMYCKTVAELANFLFHNEKSNFA